MSRNSEIIFVNLKKTKVIIMSIAEMKLAAINEISKLNDEKAIKEVLVVLSRFAESNTEKELKLFQYYDSIKKQYGKVLEKLAQ
jgi:hypothetical protein